MIVGVRVGDGVIVIVGVRVGDGVIVNVAVWVGDSVSLGSIIVVGSWAPPVHEERISINKIIKKW